MRGANRPPVEACYKRIGNRIRILRLANGLSQRELAAAVNTKRGRKRGLARAHIANMERGEQRIWPHHLEQVARVLKVPTDYFFIEIWRR